MAKRRDSAMSDHDTTDQAQPFIRLPVPTDAPNHAVYGSSLLGPGLIERFDAYGNPSSLITTKEEESLSSDEEIVYFDCQIGSYLTGHAGIVHGGIVSLLFDEACGWGYEGVINIIQANSNSVSGSESEKKIMAVTGNLNVNFRQPLQAGEWFRIRVYHTKTDGRKVALRASLESVSGDVVYADATCLYIMLRSRL